MSYSAEEILQVFRDELAYIYDKMHDHYCNVLSDSKEGKDYSDGYEDAREFVYSHAAKLDIEYIMDSIHDMQLEKAKNKEKAP